MRINGKHFHTIWLKEKQPDVVQIIDQRKLPFQFKTIELKTHTDTFLAIKEMAVRGAPLIGVTAAYGMYLAILNYKGDNLPFFINEVADYLKSSRPTAINLAFAVDSLVDAVKNKNKNETVREALNYSNALKYKEIQYSNNIGEAGLLLIKEIYKSKKQPVNILTHCNAGWLACIDWGTATAPIYKAHLEGIPVHVWVDETRPRNQGARLTAYELGEENIPHTVIPDNTGGHLMQHGLVDIVIVGSDRTTITGDVANKIGTYLKALAAKDNNIPFYVALPSTSIDWEIENGLLEIPIEERDETEVSFIEGWTEKGIASVRLIPEKSNAANYGFDVTPSRLVTGLITECGLCEANKKSILKLFPEKR
jgi:methylthioribose-1-phosphate isomerase